MFGLLSIASAFETQLHRDRTLLLAIVESPCKAAKLLRNMAIDPSAVSERTRQLVGSASVVADQAQLANRKF